MMTIDTKTERNKRVEARWDALYREGLHGHYESLFQIVREEVGIERKRCAEICDEGVEKNPDAAEILMAAADLIRNPVE